MSLSFLTPLLAIWPLLFWGCDSLDLIPPAGIELGIDADSVVFAVIGDYGKAGEDEEAVANMVGNWTPDFIITTGDNNYQRGEYATLRENIGQYYGDYIYNFDAPAEYRCNGKAFHDSINRFFPSPGNHDEAGSDRLEPYLNYFTLPGVERYYTFTWGNAAFYSINSLASADLQAQQAWLEEAVRNSGQDFQIVYFHHSPYSPGNHGDTDYMKWDFHAWGVDVVITGHDHMYGRLEKEEEAGLTYIINGLGGKSIYSYHLETLDPSVIPVTCYNDHYGAMRCEIHRDRMVLEFYAIDHPEIAVDQFVIAKDPASLPQ